MWEKFDIYTYIDVQRIPYTRRQTKASGACTLTHTHTLIVTLHMVVWLVKSRDQAVRQNQSNIFIHRERVHCAHTHNRIRFQWKQFHILCVNLFTFERKLMKKRGVVAKWILIHTEIKKEGVRDNDSCHCRTFVRQERKRLREENPVKCDFHQIGNRFIFL